MESMEIGMIFLKVLYVFVHGLASGRLVNACARPLWAFDLTIQCVVAVGCLSWGDCRLRRWSRWFHMGFHYMQYVFNCVHMLSNLTSMITLLHTLHHLTSPFSILTALDGKRGGDYECWSAWIVPWQQPILNFHFTESHELGWARCPLQSELLFCRSVPLLRGRPAMQFTNAWWQFLMENMMLPGLRTTKSGICQLGTSTLPAPSSSASCVQIVVFDVFGWLWVQIARTTAAAYESKFVGMSVLLALLVPLLEHHMENMSAAGRLAWHVQCQRLESRTLTTPSKWWDMTLVVRIKVDTFLFSTGQSQPTTARPACWLGKALGEPAAMLEETEWTGETSWGNQKEPWVARCTRPTHAYTIQRHKHDRTG